MTDDFLDAPCVFCGYDGAGYWQTGTHANGCVWRCVGGRSTRRASLNLKALFAELQRRAGFTYTLAHLLAAERCGLKRGFALAIEKIALRPAELDVRHAFVARTAALENLENDIAELEKANDEAK